MFLTELVLGIMLSYKLFCLTSWFFSCTTITACLCIRTYVYYCPVYPRSRKILKFVYYCPVNIHTGYKGIMIIWKKEINYFHLFFIIRLIRSLQVVFIVLPHFQCSCSLRWTFSLQDILYSMNSLIPPKSKHQQITLTTHSFSQQFIS